MGPTLPPPTFMQLASLLPNLRDLDLGGLRGGILPAKTLDLYFFYSNLSQLRSLEALRLPTAALLPGIEALAGKLKCLNIQGFHVGRNDGDTHMSVKAIAAVRQLSKLTTLAVHGPAFYPAAEEGGGAGGQASGALGDLLDALPPALESLCWGGGDPEFMSIWLRKDDDHDGRWALTVASCSFSDLFELVARALRPCRALRSAERPRLILENMTATALEGHDEETLHALAQLYDISMETELVVDSSCGLEVLQRVLGLLRAVPDLGFRGFPNDRYGVSFARPEGGPQQAETAARPLPAPAAVLELALDSMAARKSIFEESLQGFRAQAAVLAAGSGGRPRAVEAEAEDGSSRVRLSGVRALPPAAALVVECRSAHGAAEAVAAALEGEGLQVVTLCQDSVTVESLGYTSSECSFEGNLHWGLKHALHAAWDAALPITTLSERLEWVLALRDLLKELPARVKVP
ncbi:hypothetical protein HYH03_005534 [Edaphochlamys debaryana]|uniref:Uncharacterized protein n=1 Tax=Edaphochlamys debaryana TaxID=47281 RepID=A0A836C0W9_9CHLO|nr:hypothetical protein HYH03_005534 [Edaphochlamys debaryana]|eukprot:KAG2496301.1 hypothetical protein HYH03_005534 [Edaphochlamys debaryana]